MGYMIWYYIRWKFGIEDMILYPISEKKSYHIYIFFSLEIWSMSREKVCDPGEFIASFKPKKVWNSCLVCLGKIKNVRCWSGAVKQADNIFGWTQVSKQSLHLNTATSGSQETPCNVFDEKAQFNVKKWPQSVECNLGLHF